MPPPADGVDVIRANPPSVRYYRFLYDAVGKAAVEMAVDGANAVMPAIIRKSDDPYQWTVEGAPLAEVANVEKMMPGNFITEDGFGITDACRRYLEPLIQGEDYPPYDRGMPVYARMKNVLVDRKLSPFQP